MAFRHAMRSLKRTPVFTTTVIFTLAVGVAAVSAMFAIVYGVLLAPLPYGEPDRLVSLQLRAPESGGIGQPPALQVTYDQRARTLDGVGFHRTGSTNVWMDGGDDGADSVIATWVSASVIPMLQIAPLLGRSFTAEEELRSGPEAVVLSESEWRSRFNAAGDVIGKTLMVNSVRRQIVGVMPERFAFPTAATRIWLPAKRVDNGSVGDFIYAGVARLAPGTTVEQAQQELTTVLPRMAEAFPSLESGSSTAAWLADVRPTPVLVPLHDEITGAIARTLWMLGAASALVLLVAWANVANLLLVRADARRSELAVRTALGASRLRTATHFLAESLILGATAGSLGLVLAYGAVKALVGFGHAGIPRLAELGIGVPTLAFTAVIIAMSVIVCVAAPAGRIWKTALLPALGEGGRGASSGRSGIRVRAAVTTLQIAVALVVTIGSALLLRTAHALYQVDPGFDATQVTTLRTQLPFARYDGPASVAFYTRLADRVRQLPSVHSVGLTMKVPMGSGGIVEQTFQVDRSGQPESLPVNVVDHGYFEAMSIPVLAGHGFRPVDLEQGTDVIISRQAAAIFFGDQAAMASVGKRIALAPLGQAYTVMGVVEDVRGKDIATEPSALIYRPLGVPTDAAVELDTPRNMALVVRSSGYGGEIVPAIRDIVRELDPTVPIHNVEAMVDVVEASMARLSLVLALMTMAAVIILALGATGVYGVMAYMVSLRSREFGVRVALGANPARIARLVAVQGLLLAANGIGAGLVLYAMAAPFLREFLFQTTVSDPMTLASATVVLLGITVLAIWFPARRAARVDPANTLRAT